MVMATKSPQGGRLNPQNTLELSQGMSVQVAIGTADAHGGNWTILLYPGAAYDEGDLTPNGGADITIRAMGVGATIAPVAAPAAGVIVSGFNLTLENVRVTAPDATMPALRVVGGNFEGSSCHFTGVGAGDAIQQIGGTIEMYHCEVPAGDVDLRADDCTINLWDCQLNGTFDTAGAVIHTVTMHNCDFGGQVLNLAATGACVYMFHNCMGMSTITDAGLLGTGHLCQCDVVGAGLVKTGTSSWIVDNSGVVAISNTNATGTITIYAGIVLAITRAIGSVVWWQDGNTLKVIPSGTITDTVIGWAVAAAAAGDTIVIRSGTYEEAVTLAAGINLKGLDKEACIINIDHAVLITMAAGCCVSGLTLNVTSDATAIGTGIELNDAACTIEDVNIILNRSAGIYATGILEDTGATARTIYIRNVRIQMTDDSNERAIAILRAGKTIYIENSWIQGSDYGMAIGVSGGAAIASIIYSFSTYYEATSAKSRSVYCNGGVIHLKNDAVAYGVYCEGNGGAVRMRNTSYKSLHRAGTGNIVDESPYLSDAPWHVQRWSFQAALANAQVTVRGTPIDAGTGQVLLEVADDVADVESVESGAEAADALSNKLTPARTPRYLLPISVDSFDAHVTMFFGMRETLGNAVPVATEHHAGFIWDGTNFKASSDDGVGIQETNLTEPSTDVLHQLEVIVFGGVTTVGWVEFYVDGALVATHVTRIPAVDLDWQHMLATAGAGGGDDIDVTLRAGGAQQCPA